MRREPRTRSRDARAGCARRRPRCSRGAGRRLPAVQVESLESRELVAFEIQNDEVDRARVSLEHCVECRHLDRLPGLVTRGQRGVPLDPASRANVAVRATPGRSARVDDLAGGPALRALGGAIGEGLDEHAVPAGALEQVADAEGVAVVRACLDEEAAAPGRPARSQSSASSPFCERASGRWRSLTSRRLRASVPPLLPRRRAAASASTSLFGLRRSGQRMLGELPAGTSDQ